jgi:hypothetical protein
MLLIQSILTGLILVSLLFTVYYSYRYRREQDPKLRGLYSSRMNIAMGLMLIILAVSQLFFFTDSVTRRIFGVICFLLGVFNFFVGIRNHMHFSK